MSDETNNLLVRSKRSICTLFDGQVKLKSRSCYPWRIVLAGITVVLVCSIFPSLHNREWFFGLLAVLGGISYFLFQQHLNDTQLFAELFEKFNDRYNKLNGPLQTLLNSKEPFTPEQSLEVIDYFNLCSEEWLFYNAGYIDELVWNAWYNGMEHYGMDHRFVALWLREAGGLSYYGFKFPVAENLKETAEP